MTVDEKLKVWKENLAGVERKLETGSCKSYTNLMTEQRRLKKKIEKAEKVMLCRGVGPEKSRILTQSEQMKLGAAMEEQLRRDISLMRPGTEVHCGDKIICQTR